MHVLKREVILNAEPGSVWTFLATPLNLNELTPPALDFTILSEVPETMYNGLMILYEINIPVFGRCRWLTEIKHIEPGVSFVDEQRIGPYRFWYHQHIVESVDGQKTRMIDRVTYRLPFGLFGFLLHAFMVKKMLDEIFDYRAEQLQKIFQGGASPGEEFSSGKERSAL